MIEIEHSRTRDVIILRASGTLTKADYDAAVPEIENAIDLAQQPLKMLIRLEDFSGWEFGALRKELTFDLKHRGDFGSIAILGENNVEEWGVLLTSLVAKSEIRYFAFEDEEDAHDWLKITSE